jgi:hypothetical protein
MRRLVIGLAAVTWAAAANADQWFVATDGDDAWSGKRAEPNADRTDGPFATLERARDAARRRKSPGGAVLVHRL